MATIAGGRKTGRTPRGDRKTIIAALPVEHLAEYLRQAELRQLALSEYLCAELARDHDLDVPSYIREVLPEITVFDIRLPDVQANSRLGKRTTIRVPVEHHTVYVRNAGQLGCTLSDYIRARLAARHHFDDADVLVERRDLLSA
ncbi:hypothetical protein H5397_08975 [Propioniciclava sp. MC1683]|jgi:hypothetical protein|uniref:hypothetical protein n=1 Tax=Propioniciclava sp. MC1683 TaxID=2760309 RepID=UPI001603685E|nr:hypothetical protein [Propioniciclava sp. MC1683]MBB1501557.1 hypothetical protein [Propioniciclava sp. MC1683]